MRLCGFLRHDFTFSYEIAAFPTKIPRRKAPMIIAACCCGMVRRTHQPCTTTLCTNVCSAINPENRFRLRIGSERDIQIRIRKSFSSLADAVAQKSGKPEAFFVVFLLTIAWLITGPIYGWSDPWQLVANTVTNVVTFIMVFVIQNSQNRDSAALQAKLDELTRSSSAKNELVGIERLTQEEIELISRRRKSRL